MLIIGGGLFGMMTALHSNSDKIRIITENNDVIPSNTNGGFILKKQSKMNWMNMFGICRKTNNIYLNDFPNPLLLLSYLCCDKNDLIKKAHKAHIKFKKQYSLNYEGDVEPQDFYTTLKGLCREKGVEFTTKKVLKFIENKADSSGRWIINGVITNDGDKYYDDIFVIATGHEHLLPMRAPTLYKYLITPIVGYVAHSSNYNSEVRESGKYGDIWTNVRDDKIIYSGKIDVGHNDLKPSDFFKKKDIYYQWKGKRPMSILSQPLIGIVEGYKNIYICNGGGEIGLTLCVYCGIIMNQHIRGDKIEPSFEPEHHNNVIKKILSSGILVIALSIFFIKKMKKK